MATQFRQHPKRSIALVLLALFVLWVAVNATFHLTPGSESESDRPEAYVRYLEARRAERRLVNVVLQPCSFVVSPRVGKPRGAVPTTVSAKVPSYMPPGVGVGAAAEDKARSETRSQRDWLQHYLPGFWQRDEARFQPLVPASVLSGYRRAYRALAACEQAGIRELAAETSFLHKWNEAFYVNELSKAKAPWERYKRVARLAMRSSARAHRTLQEARRAGRVYLDRLKKAALRSSPHGVPVDE